MTTLHIGDEDGLVTAEEPAEDTDQPEQAEHNDQPDPAEPTKQNGMIITRTYSIQHRHHSGNTQ